MTIILILAVLRAFKKVKLYIVPADCAMSDITHYVSCLATGVINVQLKNSSAIAQRNFSLLLPRLLQAASTAKYSNMHASQSGINIAANSEAEFIVGSAGTMCSELREAHVMDGKPKAKIVTFLSLQGIGC